MYNDYISYEWLISPINLYKCKRITKQNIKQFGFPSIEELHKAYPNFPLISKKYLKSIKNNHLIIFNKSKSKEKKKLYLLNPLLCKNCKSNLDYNKRHNKFCSKKCSATFLNKGKLHTQTTKNKIKKALTKEKRTKIKSDIIPKHKTGLIKITRIILKLDDSIVIRQHHVEQIKTIIYNHLYNDKLSPMEISLLYNLGYTKSTLGIHIKKHLGIPLRKIRDAVLLAHKNNNTLVTDKKKIYRNNCQFKFSPWQEPSIKGYYLLSKYRIHPHKKNNNK